VLASLMICLLVLAPQSAKKERQQMMREIAQLREQVYELEKRIAQLEQKPDPTAPLKNDILALNADVKDQLRQLRLDLGQLGASIENAVGRIAKLEEAERRVALQTAPDRPDTVQPTTTVSGELLQQQVQQARLDFDRGKYAVAATAYRDLLENFPDSQFDTECRFFLARSLFEQDQYREASELLAQVSTQPSEFRLQALLYEAQAYFHTGSFAKAVAILDDLILRNPDTQEAAVARRFMEKNGLD